MDSSLSSRTRGSGIGRLLIHGLLLGLVGCGSNGATEGGKRVYTSPEEANQKKADLFDAMKGGAYGSAGKRSAPIMNTAPK